jgi:hypothetical protein
LKEGWYNFALEHVLELDDVLVFKVIDDSWWRWKSTRVTAPPRGWTFVLITLSCILHAWSAVHLWWGIKNLNILMN